MPTFTYTARDQVGSVQAGRLDGVNEDDVISQLQHRGLLVTSIARKDIEQEAKPLQRLRKPRRMHTKVKTDDHVLLCQQLATMIEAGVPLLKSLSVVTSQIESRKLLLALEEVRRDVEAGRSFRDALSKHPNIFSPLWLNLVETGEASGHLAQSLQQLARHFEAEQHLKNETKTALTYPAFLMVAALGVVMLFVYWLIPKFTVMFASMDIELPALTRAVVGISEGARRYFFLIVGSVIATGYLLRRYLRTEGGQWMRDRIILRLPLFSSLFSYIYLAEFSRGLSTLLESGVPLLSALTILENSATNRLFGKAIAHVKQAVQEGRAVADPMAQEEVFPPMAVQMVQVGEEVGELSKMADRIARHYEARVEIFIARMTRLFEPIAIVVMGVIVLVIVLSIFMPIFQMASGPKAA